MLLTLAAAALALAGTASAHAQVFGITVNGEHQGDGRGNYLRAPGDHGPVRAPEVGLPQLICNRNGSATLRPAPNFVGVRAGDRIAFQWYHARPNDPSDYVLDDSHKGALLTYIAPYTAGDGTGPIWSKLQHEGFADGQWATHKLIANGGFVEFTLPPPLRRGRYLVRQEIVALHRADGPGKCRGPEFYPSCVQIDVVESAGDAVPDQNFDINQGYSSSNTGLWFNVHIPMTTPYVPPGPEVWVPN